MARTNMVKRLLFGSTKGISGTVYGTIMVMATVAAGSAGADTDAWHLAVLVAVTVIVLWIAHLYSHALADSLHLGRPLERSELQRLASRELAIPLAAVVPVVVLVLAAFGIVREQTAVWLALGVGVGTLAVQGSRYAANERMGPKGRFVAVALNVLLGLVIVGLEVLLAH